MFRKILSFILAFTLVATGFVSGPSSDAWALDESVGTEAHQAVTDGFSEEVAPPQEPDPEKDETPPPDDTSADSTLSEAPTDEASDTPQAQGTEPPVAQPMAALVESDGLSGTFYLVAEAHDYSLLIHPIKISYGADETIASVLSRLPGHTITLAENEITAIDGVEARFLRASDSKTPSAADALENPASALKDSTLVLRPAELPFQVGMWFGLLVKAIADYDTSAAAQKSPAAQKAYSDAIARYAEAAANDIAASVITPPLQKAIKDAEAYEAGPRSDIVFDVKMGGAPLDGAEVKVTDSRGAVALVEGGVASLIHGDYSLQVDYAPQSKRVTGNFSVPLKQGGNTIELDFPQGDFWLGGIAMYDSTYYVLGAENPLGRQPVEYMMESQIDSYQYGLVVPDYCEYMSVMAARGEDTPEDPGYWVRSAYDAANGMGIEYNNGVWHHLPVDKALEQTIQHGGNGFYTFGAGTKDYSAEIQPCYNGVGRNFQDAFLYTQSYRIDIKRSPSLTDIKVAVDGAEIPLSTPFYHDDENCAVSGIEGAAIEIQPSAFGTFEEGYEVSVDGVVVPEGQFSAPIILGEAGTSLRIPIRVLRTDSGLSKEYYLTVNILEAQRYTIEAPHGSEVVLETAAGGKVTPIETELGGGTDDTDLYVFNLVEGEEYTYTVTEDTYYSTLRTFRAAEGEDSFKVTVDTAHYFKGIMAASRDSEVQPFFQEYFQVFGSLENEYSLTVPDGYQWPHLDGYYEFQAFCLWAELVPDAPTPEGSEIYAAYPHAGKLDRPYIEPGVPTRSASIQPGRLGPYTGAPIYQDLVYSIPYGGAGTSVELRYDYPDGDEIRRSTIMLDVHRDLGANTVEVESGGVKASLSPAFERNTLEYEVTVPALETSLNLDMATVRRQLATNNTTIADIWPGCNLSATVNGVEMPWERQVKYEKGKVGNYVAQKFSSTVPLSGGNDTEYLEVTLSNNMGDTKTYTVKVKKIPASDVNIILEPEDATLRLTGPEGDSVFPNETTGTYRMMPNQDYSYILYRSGYVTKSETLSIEPGQTELTLSLEPSPQNPKINPDLESAWPDFRGNPDNNGITTSPVPTDPDNTALHWAARIGGGWSAGAAGVPILVGDYLVSSSGTKILMVDTVTGQEVALGNMVATATFAIAPPLYAQGMIFVSLAGGTIQAFNATPQPDSDGDGLLDIESLWVYVDKSEPGGLGGQSNAPLSYHSGYVYTGYWNSETGAARWVCVTAQDEDPSQPNEYKYATWTYEQKGGFYWAGAVVKDNFMLVGTDDGATGWNSKTSRLVSLDPLTGKEIDSIEKLNGDIRSAIAYDTQTDRYYFTSKGGTFYSVALNADGTFKKHELKHLDLGGMSTSTPVIYNGRAYVGVAADYTSNFTKWGNSIAVIDIESWSVAYKANSKGYPQTSGLETTAYEAEDGYTYVYFIENVHPGAIRYIKDKPGITHVIDGYDEVVNTGTETIVYPDCAPILFNPQGEQGSVALCSPIVDSYGTMYFKNDSGYMMAVGATLERIEVTTPPDKVVYTEGEVFDPTGMEVIGSYSNGITRDISSYVACFDGKLATDMISIAVEFPYIKYNNSGILEKPRTEVAIEVLSKDESISYTEAVSAIDAIGEVSYDPECKQRIGYARATYEKLSERQKEAVANYDILEKAESRYQILDDASAGRLSVFEAIGGMAGIDKASVEVIGSTDVTLASKLQDLLNAIPTDPSGLVALENGAKVHITIEIGALDAIPDTERNVYQQSLDSRDLSHGVAYDISIYRQIEGKDKERIRRTAHNRTIDFEVKIPDDIYQANRRFSVMRIHNGAAEQLYDKDLERTTVTFSSALFSTFGLVYAQDDIKARDPITPNDPQNLIQASPTPNAAPSAFPRLVSATGVAASPAVAERGTDAEGSGLTSSEIAANKGEVSASSIDEAFDVENDTAKSGRAGLEAVTWASLGAGVIATAGVLFYRRKKGDGTVEEPAEAEEKVTFDG